jgi:PhnB protein
MHLNPYLLFDGHCEAAFKFYAQVLKGKIESIFKHSEAPPEMKVAFDWKDKVMHARLVVGDQVLLGSDAPPSHYSKPQGFSVSYSLKDTAEGSRVFNELSQGGQIKMPFGKTFWSPGFGMLEDRFGIPWMINCE